MYLDALRQSHILIAGATGSGKSVLLDNLIQAHFAGLTAGAALLDPKKVSFTKWTCDRRVIAHAVNDGAILATLRRLAALMDARYDNMMARGIEKTDAPHVYIYIDELADLVSAGGEVIQILTHLLRLGRAAGIHIIAATQDPSRRTLPAFIQQNFTAFFALRCRSAIESKQVIGYPGAENLPLYGYALYLSPDLYRPEKVKIDLQTPEQLQAAIYTGRTA